MREYARALLRILPYLIAATTASGQTAQDTARRIADIDADIAKYEAVLQQGVWPGYRFTQLGVMYVIPGRAKIAAHWPGAPPDGMKPLSGSANTFWTDTGVVRWQAGLPVASLSVTPGMSRGAVAGLAMHEAFHAFESTQRKDGRRFGAGENAFLTSQYPVFDVVNEALFSVEAKLLRSALLAKTQHDARVLAQQFLAVRKQRQARLDTSFVNYEKAAEMHEGMAQYVLLRGLAVLAEQDRKYASAARTEEQAEGDLLANTLAASNLSIRRRAYAAGSYLGLLLDKLAVANWKQRVMNDEWVQDVLASAVGSAPLAASTREGMAAVMRPAVEAVESLRKRRLALRDSLLDSKPLRLVIDPSMVGGFGWCGFDPQNLLPTGAGQLLHTRMLTLCSGSTRVAQIYQASVQEQGSGRITTPVDAATLEVRSNGEAREIAVGADLTLENTTVRTDDVELTFARVHVLRSATTLLLIPLRTPASP